MYNYKLRHLEILFNSSLELSCLSCFVLITPICESSSVKEEVQSGTAYKMC